MAMAYDKFLVSDQNADLDARIAANDKQRFWAVEELKAIRVRVGITEARRAELVAQQSAIRDNCLLIKVGLRAARGNPMADPTSWSYETPAMNGNARTALRDGKIKEIEAKYWSLERDKDRISRTMTDVARRDAMVAQIGVQQQSLELEKAERNRDTSNPAAP